MKKKKWIIFAVVLLIIGAAATILFIKYKEKQEAILIKEIKNTNEKSLAEYDDSIEYGTELLTNDFEEQVLNKKKLYKDTKISFDYKNVIQDKDKTILEVGEYDVFLKLIHEKIIIEKTYVLKVVDTVFPVIDDIPDRTITVGDKIDIKSGIKATDLVDGELEFEVIGEFDNNKAGEYSLKAKSVDKNGNETIKEFKVIVKEKPKVSYSSSNNSNSNNSSGGSRGYFNGSMGTQSENEQALKAALSTISQKGWGYGNSFSTAQSIGNYIANSISYGGSNRNWTAYSGLVNKTGTCWAYAQSYYMIAKELGLNVRIVSVRNGGMQSGYFTVKEYGTEKDLGMIGFASDHMGVMFSYNGHDIYVETQMGTMYIIKSGVYYKLNGPI